jgi:hypothetical protein
MPSVESAAEFRRRRAVELIVQGEPSGTERFSEADVSKDHRRVLRW